jgi:hypothetical protein
MRGGWRAGSQWQHGDLYKTGGGLGSIKPSCFLGNNGLIDADEC